jgi:hypothetical protein
MQNSYVDKKKSLKIPKDESEIEDTMAKCKGTKRQTTIYKTTPSIRT